MQRKNREIKQIFFDLDGTLLDTAPQFYLALSNLIERKQQEKVSFDEVRNLVSDGVSALVNLAFEISESHKNFESLKNELLEEYSRYFLDSQLFDGVDELLNDLKRKKILWGIVTNKPKYLAKEIFKILKWPESTKILICPQDVSGNRKPDPSALLKAISLGGFSAEETIYVGDNWRDSEAAINAKIDFLFANYGYGKEFSIKKENLKGVIQKPLEILEFLN
tara:strand:- start:645 stop:1310 length:666 start_codon:yes stop_codon:yes gene_type:complete